VANVKEKDVNQQKIEEALKVAWKKGLENQQKISKLEKKIEKSQAMVEAEK
jgi:hypothetical protein